MLINFRNDYSDVGHPLILKSLFAHLDDSYVGYGNDEMTKSLKELVGNKVSQDVDIYVLSGGTQTNLTLISKVLCSYETVISVDSGHINVHETGAVEGTGHKIVTSVGKDGKLYSDDIEQILALHTENYMVKPKLVYISNSTEIGTIYTKTELKLLYKCCQKNHLFLFMDGARLPVALTSKKNDLTLADIAQYTDAFYLGGTKNGMPYGELLIIKNELIKKDFSYHLKNRGAMLSKSFVLSIMFLEMFEDDLYLKLATNANEMAYYLVSALTCKGYIIKYPNPTNQVFIELSNELIISLALRFNFEIWEKGNSTSVIRLVTSWKTTKLMCDELINEL